MTVDRFIKPDRSLIIAADVKTVEACGALAFASNGLPFVSAIKTGFLVGYDQGLRRAVEVVKYNNSALLVIHDHQKAATDIPPLGAEYASLLAEAGVDAAILFPHSGPATQTEWTKACQGAGLTVLLGEEMTHPQFLASDGGYIVDSAPERAFRLACDQGVRDFIVPGNKIGTVKRLYDILVEELGEGNFTLYAPGFVAQGGVITEYGKVAGPRFHAIVGSAFYSRQLLDGTRRLATEDEMRAAMIEYSSQLAV